MQITKSIMVNVILFKKDIFQTLQMYKQILARISSWCNTLHKYEKRNPVLITWDQKEQTSAAANIEIMQDVERSAKLMSSQIIHSPRLDWYYSYEGIALHLHCIIAKLRSLLRFVEISVFSFLMFLQRSAIK